MFAVSSWGVRTRQPHFSYFLRFSSIFKGLLDFADRCNHWEPEPSSDDAGLAKERSLLHGLRCVQYIRYCGVFSKGVGRRHLPTNLHCMPLDTTTTSPTQPFFSLYVMTAGYYNIIFEVIIVVSNVIAIVVAASELQKQ